MVDSLKGVPETITTAFPDTLVQTSIVHLIRYSTPFAATKERKTIAAALHPVYQAQHAQGAAVPLGAFDQGPWGRK